MAVELLVEPAVPLVEPPGVVLLPAVPLVVPEPLRFAVLPVAPVLLALPVAPLPTLALVRMKRSLELPAVLEAVPDVPVAPVVEAPARCTQPVKVIVCALLLLLLWALVLPVVPA